MSKKRKTSEVEFEYTGTEEREDVPKDVTIVRFHSSVTEVGDHVFRDCERLNKVIFNEGLKKIGCESFYECRSLESVTLPSTVIEIGSYAFQWCRSLKEVVLNEGLQTIGKNAFFNCEELKHINLPSTVTDIGDSAFRVCSGLREVVLNESLQTIGAAAFAHCKNAFFNCKELKYVNLPSTVTDIGERFEGSGAK